MTYYYKDTAGQEVGPVNEDEIHAFRAGGLRSFYAQDNAPLGRYAVDCTGRWT